VRHQLSLEVDDRFEDLRQRLRSIRILGEATPKVSDTVLATGEDLSARIVAAAFGGVGLRARWIDSRRVVRTDSCFGEACPDAEAVRVQALEHVAPLVAGGVVPVLGGYVGANGEGETTTLGRGGSDTSAAVIGAALQAQEIQIWTDVDGLMSADPRLVPAARTLPRVSFAEAAELAFYGARVLHPHCIAPAVRQKIPVRILNSLRPEGEGTQIVENCESGDARALATVASRPGVCIVRITSGRMQADASFLPRVLEGLGRLGLAPDLLVATEVAVSIVLSRTVAREELEGVLGSMKVEIEPERAIICVVGAGLARDAGFRTRVLTELAAVEPETVALGASRTSLAAALPQSRLEVAVRALHRRFVEGGGEP
jgi:aspartate kinase